MSIARNLGGEGEYSVCITMCAEELAPGALNMALIKLWIECDN